MSGVQEHVSGAIVGALQGLPPNADPALRSAAVVAAAQSAAASVPPPQPDSVANLWYLLVGGLVAAVIGSLVGVIWAVVDGDAATSPDTVVTIFSTSLAALVGLFVKSPNT